MSRCASISTTGWSDFQARKRAAIDFQYDQSWLAWEPTLPISLSLPLRETPFRGESVIAVFDNLLPDSDALRRRVAENVGSRGTDAYSMLAAIGHDCVGALQFIAGDDEAIDATGTIKGEAVDDEAIDKLLRGLAQAPLGLNRNDDFRISIAGAQEKTALLYLDGRWLKPHGTTPTTHIFRGPVPGSAQDQHQWRRLAGFRHRPLDRRSSRVAARCGGRPWVMMRGNAPVEKEWPTIMAAWTVPIPRC